MKKCKTKRVGFFQSCKTCGGYIACVYGTKYELTCVEGLMWNDKTKTCEIGSATCVEPTKKPETTRVVGITTPPSETSGYTPETTPPSDKTAYTSETTIQSVTTGYTPETTPPSVTTGYTPETTTPSDTAGYTPETKTPSDTTGYPPETTTPSDTTGYTPETTPPSVTTGYTPETATEFGTKHFSSVRLTTNDALLTTTASGMFIFICVTVRMNLILIIKMVVFTQL